MPKPYESHIIKQDELFSEKSASIISNKDGNNNIYVSNYSLVNAQKFFNDIDNNINNKFIISNITNNNNFFMNINNNNKNNTDYRNLSELLQFTSRKNVNQSILNLEKESKNKTETSELLAVSKNVSKSYINETKLLEKTNSENDITLKTERIQSHKICSGKEDGVNSVQNENIDNCNENIPTMNNMSEKYITHIMKKMKVSKRKEKIKLMF